MTIDFDTTTQEYVEIIHDLQKKHKVARVKDIAEQRGVTRSSVSTVLNLLKKKNLITHEQYGLVELTEQGEQLGETLARSHQIIKDFLINILNISPQIAEEDACKLEHHISPETLRSLINFLGFVENCPYGGPLWLDQLKKCGGYGQGLDRCVNCRKNSSEGRKQFT